MWRNCIHKSSDELASTEESTTSDGFWIINIEQRWQQITNDAWHTNVLVASRILYVGAR